MAAKLMRALMFLVKPTLRSSPTPFIPAFAPTPRSIAWAVDENNKITQASPIEFLI
jgi:hypothetical protein